MALIASTSPLLHRLDYSELDSDQQSVVDTLVDVASELIEKYCNRIFLAANYVEVINGTGENYIIVKNNPVNSLTSIEFLDSVLGTWASVDDAEFNYDGNLGQIWWATYSESTSKYRGVFPELLQNIRVTYNGGYTTVPMPVQMACAQMVEVMYDPTLGAGTIEKEKLGEYFYQLNTKHLANLLTDQNKMLALYRRRR